MAGKGGRTAGTRVGRGAGVGGPAQGVGAAWGGPANGAGARGAGPGRPRGVKDGDGKKTVADLLEEAGARWKIAQHWLEIIENPDHPMHAQMLDKGAQRLDGAPIARTEHSGTAAFVLIGEPEAESADEWERASQP